MFSCLTIYPDDNNTRQVNQARFPQNMDGPHRGVDQESSRKISKYKNWTPAHETKGTTINHKKNPDTDP